VFTGKRALQTSRIKDAVKIVKDTRKETERRDVTEENVRMIMQIYIYFFLLNATKI
jgi:hypothetical protein